MLATLLESRAVGQPRGGGAALSVAAHLALVGLAAASTVRHPRAPLMNSMVAAIHFQRIAPPPRAPATGKLAAVPSTPPAGPLTAQPIWIPPLGEVGTQLPPITMGGTPTSDGLSLGAVASAGLGPRGILDGGRDARDPARPGLDLLVRIVTSTKPRYPETLREAQIEGSVLIQFTVDTTGRVDLATVRVLASTHPLFTRAVLEALPTFRFKPAEVAGARVAATGEMPFEFSLTGARRD